MLTRIQQERWDAYQRLEALAPRTDTLRGLDAFLDTLADSPGGEWFPWARSIAERVVDNGEALIIRFPLFERAVFPALLAGYQSSLPGCARWLAGLSELLYRSRICQEQLPEAERNELGLLRAALRHDPTDQWSRRRLLEKQSDWLRFSLHELPDGVLYGMDGALPEQCRQLEYELDEFCKLVEEEKTDRYGELIDRCRYHFRAYQEYLLNPKNCQSYALYLAQDGKQNPAESSAKTNRLPTD